MQPRPNLALLDDRPDFFVSERLVHQGLGLE
jgi:hypothetical protein